MEARLDDSNRTDTYRFYIANSLYHSARGQGLVKTLGEILYPVAEDKVDGGAIAMSIINGAGLKIVG